VAAYIIDYKRLPTCGGSGAVGVLVRTLSVYCNNYLNRKMAGWIVASIGWQVAAYIIDYKRSPIVWLGKLGTRSPTRNGASFVTIP
jgi:hypothetical protein